MTGVMNHSDWQPPRSVLFVPADRPDLFAKALASRADALCLDLEDGVAASQKPAARRNIAAAIESATKSGAKSGTNHAKPVYVRINADHIDADIAALGGHIVPLIVPKASSHQQLAAIAAHGLPVIAMIEDLAALQRFLTASAGVKDGATGDARPAGVVALALGTEDLSADLGVMPHSLLLTHALYDLVKLGRLWDVPVLGMPGSIANFTDGAAFDAAIATAAGFGAIGAFCIHPAQIPALNTGFAPSASVRHWADGVIACATQIEQSGVATHPDTGAMLDAPVLKQARDILRRNT